MAEIAPVGMDDFRKLRERNKVYVDKTLLIQDFLRYYDEVTLITRPRRFGKTLNMTMLRDFFDVIQDSKDIFSGLAIMDTEHADKINTIPVIYFTLKGCNGTSYELMKASIAEQIFDECDKYHTIIEASDVDKSPSAYRRFNKVYEMLDSGKIDEHLLKYSLTRLMRVVHEFYGIRPIVLIDEYDQPIMNAHEQNFRSEMTGFFVTFFGNAFKSNEDLGQAVLTGIQRVAKESIFSQLNNLNVYTVLSERYSSYFGLTEVEVEQLFKLQKIETAMENVREYYDGYIFGGKTHVYNPWSILSFITEKKLKGYWLNTSTNKLIHDLIAKADNDFISSFDKLIANGTVRVVADLDASFMELSKNSTLWGLLINAGYITVLDEMGFYLKTVKIPNNEVKEEFIKIVANRTKLNDEFLTMMFQGIASNDMQLFKEGYQYLVDQYMSFRHQSEEAFHSFILGLSIAAGGVYKITSEREAGDGLPDVYMESLNPTTRPHVIIEVKALKEGEKMETALNKALKQIEDKRYDSTLRGDVLHIGLVHDGKKCELVSKRKDNS